MTQDAFAHLPETLQIDIIVDNAVQMCDRKQGVFKYCLFQLYLFYVEISFYVKDMSMERLKCFSLSEIPESYLLQIDISGLL